MYRGVLAEKGGGGGEKKKQLIYKEQLVYLKKSEQKKKEAPMTVKTRERDVMGERKRKTIRRPDQGETGLWIAEHGNPPRSERGKRSNTPPRGAEPVTQRTRSKAANFRKPRAKRQPIKGKPRRPVVLGGGAVQPGEKNLLLPKTGRAAKKRNG